MAHEKKTPDRLTPSCEGLCGMILPDVMDQRAGILGDIAVHTRGTE
jgi:hypothetical protein